jgi:hypothetical protein
MVVLAVSSKMRVEGGKTERSDEEWQKGGPQGWAETHALKGKHAETS